MSSPPNQANPDPTENDEKTPVTSNWKRAGKCSTWPSLPFG